MKLRYHLLLLLSCILLGFSPGASLLNCRAASAQVPLADGTYRLLARHSGLALSVEDAALEAHADVVQLPWSGGRHQQWTFRHEGDGLYVVTAGHSGQALDVYGIRNGGNIKQDEDDGGADKRWRIREVLTEGGTRYYRLNNALSRKSPEVAGGVAAAGATVEQQRYEGLAHQQWRIEPVRTGAAGGGLTAPTPVRLPLEVIGPDGYIVEAAFHAADVAGLTHLYLQVHQPGYRDASVNPGRGAKASVRLNGGPWAGLTNQTVTCLPNEAAFGCLDGAFHTVRLTVDLSRLGSPGVQAGRNVLAFRFNGTDGITTGYRILDVNLLRGGRSGTRALPESAFAHEDPASWTPPRPDPAEVAEGKRLWYEAKLVDRPGGPPIRATCSSCHARDGRDLKYFNYSNRSIQERAKFHSLSEAEAERVASYIRSLDTPAPKGGRPWNPPYQPGPGLDARPVEEWAAGAGLEWVLETDGDVRPHLFPGGIEAGSVDPSGTLNLRELPISLQLPDWNAWLPTTHPIDVWGDFFLQTSPVEGSGNNKRGDALGHYHNLHSSIQQRGIPGLLELGYLDNRVEGFAAAGVKYFWDNRYGEGAKYLPEGIRKETALRSIRHWTAVKLWETAQEYGLEDKAPAVYGEGSEPRAWIGGARQVFDLAPHLSADENRAFAFHSLKVGRYASTVWYQLQVILNAGNRNGGTNTPVDWNYQPNHVAGLNRSTGKAPQSFLSAASWIKLIQSFHDGRDVLRDDPFVRQGHPGRWADFVVFQTLDPATRAALFDVLLTTYMDAVERRDRPWERADEPRKWEPESYVPRQIDDMSWSRAHQRGRYADLWYTMIPTFRTWGVEGTIVDRLINWGEQMWPKGDWEALRSSAADQPASSVATNTVREGMPHAYELEGAYPSPFNPQTTIRIALPTAAEVRIEVFDALGRRVAVLVDGTWPAGRHEAIFEAAHLPGGVYLYRIEAAGAAGPFQATGKVVLVK